MKHASKATFVRRVPRAQLQQIGDEAIRRVGEWASLDPRQFAYELHYGAVPMMCPECPAAVVEWPDCFCHRGVRFVHYQSGPHWRSNCFYGIAVALIEEHGVGQYRERQRELEELDLGPVYDVKPAHAAWLARYLQRCLERVVRSGVLAPPWNCTACRHPHTRPGVKDCSAEKSMRRTSV